MNRLEVAYPRLAYDRLHRAADEPHADGGVHGRDRRRHEGDDHRNRMSQGDQRAQGRERSVDQDPAAEHRQRQVDPRSREADRDHRRHDGRHQPRQDPGGLRARRRRAERFYVGQFRAGVDLVEGPHHAHLVTGAQHRDHRLSRRPCVAGRLRDARGQIAVALVDQHRLGLGHEIGQLGDHAGERPVRLQPLDLLRLDLL